MNKMSFSIKTPNDLLKKLALDLEEFNSDCSSSVYAINFILTAYHLRDWIWNHYFKVKEKNLIKNDFINKIYEDFPDMKLIKDLANGSKHYSLYNDPTVKGTDITPAIEDDEAAWDKDECTWDYYGCRIHTKDGRTISCQDLFNRVFEFWTNYLARLT